MSASRRARRPAVHTALVIGAGFTGLGTAIKLRESGIEDLVILERADRVGGTWRDATYPGAACDIPSQLYSFSFAKNPGWSRTYSPSAEIHAHIEELAERFDLVKDIRFNTEVTRLAFDKKEAHWVVSAGRRKFYARTVVVASGPLSDASLPGIRGIEDYQGAKILSARWDHDYDFAGKNVAVIGTGASAVQIIPELVKTAGSVKVFQRTAGWVMPRVDFETPAVAKAVFARVPAAQQAARTALFLAHEAAATGLVWDTPVTSLIQQAGKLHLRLTVKDKWLRRQLTPDFRAGCKRMLMSSDYYPALQQDNCKLITWPIATITPGGIQTSDGLQHEVDAIVFATGYDVHLEGPPYPVTGLDGQSLQDEWSGHPQAYKSASAHGYPNLFFTCGPNSGPGHNSLLVYVQGQIEYAVAGIRTIVEQDLRWLDVKKEVQDAYNVSMQKRLRSTTWMSGCASWYLTADGFNASMYPGFATQYLRQMQDFRIRDYEVSSAAAQRLWNASSTEPGRDLTAV
ncbi:NAD(P)/FAD-dependent oxidoreductase [Nocardioides marmoriginsengisoli]|uniref:NAD(P)/FAD-dependent oxidoreductase n=1 Tax=Nocardioides marmoriginsengisoli TaxID=661483 RepID=A0A3N0CAR1_9ACTN|nr:NAD(P)/FAD-dependent oxidoreductase [Nocardioides marmoriginsengisoli]RNL60540.1 NAD(P)/FAD-dependent oxidoreductase [Nocardioides marmoriginsengisoli]